MAEEVFLFLPAKVRDEHFVLNNGISMPKITFGVNQIVGIENMCNAVDKALEKGYRSFDCSPECTIEEDLGIALELLLPKHDLKREDIIITSKIHPKDYGMGSATEAFWRSCKRLKTNYIDLFLMQWPGGHNLHPENEENRFLREETWKEIVQLSSKGVIKSPGVCHFTCRHLKNILGCSEKIPVVNQVEFHPRFPQFEVLKYCEDHNILLQACGFNNTLHPLVLNDESVKTVAKTVNKTPAQVIFKWIINKNVGVIIQSEKDKSIQQNSQFFDFVLEKPEMDIINAIQTREKYLRNPICVI